MYGKIFESMYEGSLYGQWEAIVTFQQMIVIADQYGVVDMTPQALAGKTSIPLKIIEKGIELLSKPDDLSRTLDQGGVRIALLDEHRSWGWEIVNYAKYRDKSKHEDRRTQNRTNKAAQRERERAAQADKQDTTPDKLKRGDPPKPKPTKPKRFAEFWGAYPKKRNEDGCKEIWVSNDLDEIADKIIAAVNTSRENDSEWKRDEGRWIPSSERYLNERRWGDVTEVPRERDPLARMLLQCCFDPVSWLAPEVLAKVSDEERAEYEYIKARNLKNGHKEPDWNSPESQAMTKELLEKLEPKPAEATTADNQGKSLSEIAGLFKPKETS